MHGESHRWNAMRKCCIGASLVESMYYWYLDDILKYSGETKKYDIGSKNDENWRIL